MKSRPAGPATQEERVQNEDIVYEVKGRTAAIRINRPRVYNAFRPRTVVEMVDASAPRRPPSAPRRCFARFRPASNREQ